MRARSMYRRLVKARFTGSTTAESIRRMGMTALLSRAVTPNFIRRFSRIRIALKAVPGIWNQGALTTLSSVKAFTWRERTLGTSRDRYDLLDAVCGAVTVWGEANWPRRARLLATG